MIDRIVAELEARRADPVGGELAIEGGLIAGRLAVGDARRQPASPMASEARPRQ